MTASDFTLVPQSVIPHEPDFTTFITPGVGVNKQYNGVSSTPTEQYELIFKALSRADFRTLYNHYYECLGDYDSFSWTTVPDYIDTSTNGTPDVTEVGSNLISNGGFDSDTTEWSNTGASLASIANGQAGNCLELTRVSGDTQDAYQTATGLTIGKLYKISAYVKSGTSGNEAFIIETGAVNGYVQATGTSSSTWTKYSLMFRTISTSDGVILLKNTATGGTMLFDTVGLYRVTQNLTGRWVKGSFNPTPIGGDKWRVSIVFEKEV